MNISKNLFYRNLYFLFKNRHRITANDSLKHSWLNLTTEDDDNQLK